MPAGGIISAVLRTLSSALLVACFLTAGVEGQRLGGGMYTSGVRGFGPGIHAFAGRMGQNGFSHGSYGRNSGYGRSGGYFLPAFLPDDASYGQPQMEPPPDESAAQPRYYWSERERLPADPQMIEIPAASQTQAPVEPPRAALFVLNSGERLEAQRFLLTTSDLSLTVNRVERTIPLASLDLDATLAANRERGIHLQIPIDHNEISLSF